MKKSEIEELIAKYNEGLADPYEVKLLEQLIEEGKVELTQLHELSMLDDQLLKSEEMLPSMQVDDSFYSMLAEEKRKSKKSSLRFQLPDWSILFPRLAFAMVLMVIGFAGGYLLQRPAPLADGNEVKMLTRQVSDLKEMMMLSLLEKESATERLRAVSLTNDMGEVSDKVTNALFETLNNDESVNVRLAALEALKPYVRDGNVRKKLVDAIGKQDSPLVQVELAQLMVELQEKKSVKELKKLLDNERTAKEVKTKIRESIEVLI